MLVTQVNLPALALRRVSLLIPFTIPFVARPVVRVRRELDGYPLVESNEEVDIGEKKIAKRSDRAGS